MSYDHVIYEKRDHVAYVTLNRRARGVGQGRAAEMS